MSALIKELKQKNENILTLHAGDVFVGTFAFNKYLGYAELDIMEELYDAMAMKSRIRPGNRYSGFHSRRIRYGRKADYATLPSGQH
jgi:hypothetical protein